MKAKLLTLCIIAANLVACSTNPSVQAYQKEASFWLGKSQEELYQAWGYPNATYWVDYGEFVATYIKRFNDPLDGDIEPYSNQMTYSAMEVPSYGLPQPQGVYYCKTSFVIRDGVVSDYNLNGDDCVAK